MTPTRADVEQHIQGVNERAELAGDKAMMDVPEEAGPVARNAAGWHAERHVWAEEVRALLARAEEAHDLKRQLRALRARLTALAARWEHYGGNTASHDAGYKDAAREIATELRAALEASHE